MKLSYNWIKAYVDFDWEPQELADRLTMTGLEVEGMHSFESVPGGLKGVVVGHVLSAEQHPNADRLRVCKVDVGAEEPLDIVCGAPNVAAGQKVPVATIGTMLYPEEGDPFAIKKGKIRGEVSMGMICAEDELGLGAGHDGIMVLDASLAPGTPAHEVFDIENDFTMEIGLTANRIDGASHFGAARDVAALRDIDTKLPEIRPEVDKIEVENPISIDIQDADRCPRYAGVYIEGVTIGESPDWLKNRLLAIGSRPINNVVDITNFVLKELGQPLHAFDADQIGGNKIIVKTLPDNTPFTTLDDVERTIRANEDLMICDGDKPVAIAGVMGGQNSEVSETTKNIFLECAYFEPGTVRKTAKKMGLSTDASFHFERGIDPNNTIYAIRRAADLILQLAGGKISAVTDVKLKEFPHFEVEFNLPRANRLMGREFTEAEVTKILNNLDIEVVKSDGTTLSLLVPPYRVDVKRPQDIMEEILRIFGYNNVPMPEHTTIALDLEKRREPFRILQKYFDYLAGSGWNEIITNSLIPQRYLIEESVDILNNLSEELGIMRDNMLTTGLDSLAWNINRKNTDLQFCEFGKTYHNTPDGYQEKEWIALFVTGKNQPDHWRSKNQSVDFFTLTREMERLQEWFGFTSPVAELVDDPQFDYGLQLKRGEAVIAKWGRANAKICAEKGIEAEVYFALIDWQRLLKLDKKSKVEFQPLSQFPSMNRDISMLVPVSTQFDVIRNLIRSCNPKMIKEIGISDVYKGKGIPEGKKSYLVNLTFLDLKKTLTDKAVDKTMDRVFAKLEKDLGVEIRK